MKLISALILYQSVPGILHALLGPVTRLRRNAVEKIK
jgi:hypothetical protein